MRPFLTFLAGQLLGWLAAIAGLCQAPTCPSAVAPDTAKGNFTVDLGDRFCVGQTVRLTNTANVQTAQYWYEYAGATVPSAGGSTLPTHKFASAGKYLIIQRGTLGGKGAYACKVVEVLNTPAPVVSLFSCSPGVVTLTLLPNAANAYDQYVINWGVAGTPTETITASQTPLSHTYPTQSTRYNVVVSGRYLPSGCGQATVGGVVPNGVPPSVQKADLTRLELTGPGTATLALTSFRGGEIEVFQRPPNGFFQTTNEKLTTSASTNVVNLKNLNNQNQACFKAVFTDACQQKQESAELCSLPLRVVAQNQQNQVDWAAYPTPPSGLAFRDYTLVRNGATLPPVVTSIGTTQRTDAPVKCGDTYAYQLTARIGAMTSVSEIKTVKGLSALTPPAVARFQSSVANGLVALAWEAPPAGTPPNDGIRKYTLTRSDDGGQTYQPLLDSTATLKFDDKTAEPSTRSFCYVIRYTDACGNASLPSAPTCPVLLRQTKSSLDWTAYRQFPNTTYSLEEVGDNGRVVRSQPVGAVLFYDPDPATLSGQQVRFRVRATGSGTGQVSYSNEVIYSLAMRLFVPEVFTPNGDGVNDAFEVKGLFIQEYKLTVFNR